jgi:solute carrier family 25 carnitine/acylcarnitine transporter 20/29
MNDFVAGWCGGVAGILVGFPLDTIKVQMQLSQRSCSTANTVSVRSMLQSMKRSPLRLFDGILSPLCSYSILVALNFGTFAFVTRRLQHHQQQHDGKQHWLNNEVVVYACAGFISGLLLSVASSPFELVKIRMQADAHERHRRFASTWECALHIVRTEGAIGGLYKGHSLR